MELGKFIEAFATVLFPIGITLLIIGNRFESLEEKIMELKNRINKLDEEIRELKKRISKLENKKD